MYFSLKLFIDLKHGSGIYWLNLNIIDNNLDMRLKVQNESSNQYSEMKLVQKSTFQTLIIEDNKVFKFVKFVLCIF